MRFVYCSNCGRKLGTKRKAMPKYGCIVELVDWHECGESVEFDISPNPVPAYTEHDKFVKKLNELQPPTSLSALSTEDLRDRRTAEHTKDDIDSAPTNLLNRIKSMLEPRNG